MNEDKVKYWNRQWTNNWKRYIRGKDLLRLYPILREHFRGKIADLGCGVTTLYKEGDDVTGIDISQVCIDMMRTRSPWGTWQVGDVFCSGLPDAEFDTVVCSHVLEHFYWQEPIIREAKRICKPDGLIVMAVPRYSPDPDHVHRKWNAAKAEDRIASHLADAECRMCAKNHYLVTGRPTATASVVTVGWSPHGHRMAIMKQSLQSLKDSTRYPHTWVMVDNGPAEQTDFVRSLQPDIHIVNAVNQGPPISRNMGAGATDSDFIAFVDNDVMFYDGWLTDHINLLRSHPQEKWIAALSDSARMRKPEHKVGEVDGGWLLSERGSSTCWVMSRLTFGRLGRWNINSSVEDYDYSIRCQNAGYSFVYNAEGPRVKHMAVHRPTFRFKNKLVDGKWVKR